MDKWYYGLPVLDKSKISKNSEINKSIIKELEENEVVLAKALFNRVLFYLILILTIGIFIWSIKLYREENNQTSFNFFLALTIGIVLLVVLFQLLNTYLLITNERLIGSLVENSNSNSFNIVKIVIPLRNIDNLVYDTGSKLQVMSKSNGYSIFTNEDEIENVRKVYYAYTKFKEIKESNSETTIPIANQTPGGSMLNKYEEIEKLSELLQKRIISQEEFDNKKRQLLGL